MGGSKGMRQQLRRRGWMQAKNHPLQKRRGEITQTSLSPICGLSLNKLWSSTPKAYMKLCSPFNTSESLVGLAALLTTWPSALWRGGLRRMWRGTLFYGRSMRRLSSCSLHGQLLRTKGLGVSQPHFGQVWGWSPTLAKLGICSPSGLPNVQSSTARPKTPLIEVFLVSLERSWNVDIENGLALVIWTPAAQVMGKRRAGSQIGSLTPDH
jgi:hypothetical protein